MNTNEIRTAFVGTPAKVLAHLAQRRATFGGHFPLVPVVCYEKQLRIFPASIGKRLAGAARVEG